MDYNELLEETKYLQYVLRSYKAHKKLENIKKQKINLLEISNTEKKELQEALFEKYLYETTSKDREKEWNTSKVLYILRVNSYFNTAFNTLGECLNYVIKRNRKRSGKRGLYKRISR